MDTIITLVKKVPVFAKKNPFEFGNFVYFLSSVSYICVGSYAESKDHLIKYRNKELDSYLKIDSELKAVKYGARVNFVDIFINALFWPVTIPISIIPYLVLYSNQEKKTN